jgi:hypothetical protein
MLGASTPASGSGLHTDEPGEPYAPADDHARDAADPRQRPDGRRETTAPWAHANGEPPWTLDVLVMAPGAGGVFTVMIAGQPESVSWGTPLEIEGLVAQPWSMGDRVGVSLRVAKLAPAGRPAARAA